MTTNFNILKEIDTDVDLLLTININQKMDIDQAIIQETNSKLIKLKQDIIDLRDTMTMMNEFISLDGEKMDIAEENLVFIDDTILETMPILEEIIELKEEVTNKYLSIKMIGGATTGGILFGAVGSFFGIIPAIVGVGIGIGGGGAVGYLSKFLVK